MASFSAGLTNDQWEVLVFIQNAFNEQPRFDSFVDSFGARFPQAISDPTQDQLASRLAGRSKHEHSAGCPTSAGAAH